MCGQRRCVRLWCLLSWLLTSQREIENCSVKPLKAYMQQASPKSITSRRLVPRLVTLHLEDEHASLTDESDGCKSYHHASHHSRKNQNCTQTSCLNGKLNSIASRRSHTRYYHFPISLNYGLIKGLESEDALRCFGRCYTTSRCFC